MLTVFMSWTAEMFVMQGTPREIFSQVETLERRHGLDVPQVTLLAYELKEIRRGCSGGNTDYRGAGECLMSIELKNITYTYSPGTAYESHALKISAFLSRTASLSGSSDIQAAGSPLIQHLNALVQPTSGQVLYNGEDVWAEKYDRKQLRSEVGLVFQYPEHQLFESDVLSDVCFGPMNQGLSREEAEVEAKKALQQVGFKEKISRNHPLSFPEARKKG